MPLYEYRCKNCGEIFDKFRFLSQSDADVRCPYCDSELKEGETYCKSCQLSIEEHH